MNQKKSNPFLQNQHKPYYFFCKVFLKKNGMEDFQVFP